MPTATGCVVVLMALSYSAVLILKKVGTKRKKSDSGAYFGKR
jgi:hypothetical protein